MRVAVVGLGNAAATLHLPALAGIESAQVVGACDTDSERCRRAAAKWKIPVFDDLERMVEEGKPDVIVVGTPPDTHFEMCRKAIECGMHLICEKPFASSVAEADAIIDAAAKAGVRVALNHEFREMPIFRSLLDQVGTDGVGELRLAQVWQLMDLPPWAEPGWRGQMLQRTLYEAGVHLVDFVVALFGERPLAVTATTATCGAKESESDAVALVTLEFSGGRVAQITQNRLCRGETQYFEVRADCSEASLRASFGGRARLTTGLFRSTRPHARFEWGVSGLAWKEHGVRRVRLASNPKDPGMIATRYVFEKTLKAFSSGGEPPASGRVGRDVLEVIASCYLSAETGNRVIVGGEFSERANNLMMGAAPE